jgi:hypothetical protein
MAARIKRLDTAELETTTAQLRRKRGAVRAS